MESVTFWSWTAGIGSVLLILWGLGLVIYERVREFLYDFEVVERQTKNLIQANYGFNIRINDLSNQIQELKSQNFSNTYDIAELSNKVAKLSKVNQEVKVKTKAKPVKKK